MLFFDYPMSTNLGDDIQTIAAMMFKPPYESAVFINRDTMAIDMLKYPNESVILNGWWTHSPHTAWPPPPQRDGVVVAVSMHICQKARHHFGRHIEWFNRSAGDKVLARDTDTEQWLKQMGVERVEFGGCLTLTIPEIKNTVFPLALQGDEQTHIKEHGHIVFVDVKGHVPGIQPDTVITHNTTLKDGNERRKKAMELLCFYAGAQLVVTSRLHCALPCAAMGIPVICLNNGPRYSGMEKFITITTRENAAKEANDILKRPNSEHQDNINYYANKLKSYVTNNLCKSL